MTEKKKEEVFDIFSRKNPLIKEESKIKIIIDHREKNSLVIQELVKMGFEIEYQQMKVGDYLVKDVIIERKTVRDFLSSMLNRRLVQQLQELQQYPNKLLLIEGINKEELYSEKKEGINPNAIRGFLISILLKFKIPIIFTKDYEDTAKFISVIAKKKQRSELPLNVKKKVFNKKEQMQYILESFPGIGPATAKKLLEKHRTLKKIFSLSKEKLEKDLGKKAGTFGIIKEEY
ncbi:3'-flap repair endonuclease Xpf [uncultured archaeon]|nr:3'-flap repair endonuclease Xpf [uncultured archaeon]